MPDSNPILSILICSLQERMKQASKLIDKLNKQAKNKPVEIIWLGDNRKMSIGKKRNYLLMMANGDYSCFIDDDDDISDDYIDEILKAAATGSDVICFQAMRYKNGIKDRIVNYSIRYDNDFNTTESYFRLPNHLMPVKTKIALNHLFENINFGEDSEFAKNIKPDLKSEFRIKKILYNYFYRTK